MTIESPLPSYDEVAEALKENAVDFSPAQLHGIFCGLICAGPGKKAAEWEKFIYKKKKKKLHQALFQELYEISYHHIIEFSFEFALLLPDDDIDINERAEALGLWCQGYLIGLKHYQVPLQNREPSEMSDTLNDIIEIADVNYGDIMENEEDESAYFELIEYVRLGVLMIFAELQSPNNRSR